MRFLSVTAVFPHDRIPSCIVRRDTRSVFRHGHSIVQSVLQDAAEPCLSGFHARTNARVRVSSRRDTPAVRERARGIFCVNVNARVIHPSELSVLYGGGRPYGPPWLIVTLFIPICRFMAPPLGRRVRRAPREICNSDARRDRDTVSSGDGRFLSFITPFVMSWWMKYSSDFRYGLVFIAKF